MVDTQRSLLPLSTHFRLLDQDCVSRAADEVTRHRKSPHPDNLAGAFNHRPRLPLGEGKRLSQATRLQQFFYFLWRLAVRRKKSVTRTPVSNRQLRPQQAWVQKRCRIIT